MNKKLNFEVENISIDDSMPNSKFAKISLDFFASGDNAHEMYVSEDVLNKTADTIFNVPIVWEYNPALDDAGSHDPLEVPCGFVKEGAEIKRVALSDGRTMLRTIGYIWKRYSGRLMEILERDDGKKPVSVEMSVYDVHVDEDGKESLLDYVFEAITILGSFMQPAIPSAGLNVLSFSQEKADYQKAYDKEFTPKEFAKYSEIDFSIPNGMKRNAKIGLELRTERGSGGTAVAVSMAKYLIRESVMTPEKAKQIAKYFARPAVSFPSDKEGDDWVAWNLYGGKSGAKLARKIAGEIQAEDESLMAYFDKLPPVEGDEALKGTEEKEDFMKEDEKEKKEDVQAEGFEEKKPEDDEVMMEKEEDSDAEEKEEMAEEEESDEATDEEEMAVPEEDDEEREDMGCDEKKYETLFAELTIAHDALQLEAVELRNFKSGIEKQQFDIRISGMLGKVKHLFDEDGLNGLREEATKNYSLGTVGAWENIVKAKGFEVSENLPPIEKDDDGIVRMGLPVSEDKKVKTTLW